MSFSFTCPYCKKVHQAKSECAGEITTCSTCGKKLIIQPDEEEKSFSFVCPYCKTVLQAESAQEGEVTTCSSCGKKLIVQRDEEASSATAGDGDSKVNEEKNTDKVDEKITDKVDRRIRQTFQVDKLEGFSLSRFMRQLFRHHSWDDVTEYLTYGTPLNTPSITEVDTSWPAPWLFVRLMLLTVLSYILINHLTPVIGVRYVFFPVLVVGVIGFPLVSLLFFWEVNILKNISVLTLAGIMVVGGFVSVIVTFLMSSVTGPYAPYWAGPVEESTKLLTMVIFSFRKKYRFKLNGLLIGAAVGTGFAFIETGGYVLRFVRDMHSVMITRSLLSPFMHIPWSAMVGFALWRAIPVSGFSFSGFFNKKFMSLFLLAIGMHMFWNSPLNIADTIVALLLALIEYTIIIYLIQDGLNEVRRIKSEACKKAEKQPAGQAIENDDGVRDA